MGARPRVLLMFPMLHPAGQQLLEENADVRVVSSRELALLKPELGEAEAIVLSTAGWVTEDVISQAPKLRVIGVAAAGVDMVDVAAATRSGIPVVNVPGMGAEPVAEHALGMMLSLAKRITLGDRWLRSGFNWPDRSNLLGTELAGKTLGVVGFGVIGRELARKAHAAFDMQVVVHDPLVDARDYPHYRWVPTIEEFLPLCDYVSLHVPLLRETCHLINEERLRLMKPTAYLVNTSRGPAVDQPALIDALRNGTIAGAGIDVFDPEPPRTDLDLFKLPNVVVTPHIAGMSEEALRRITTTAATQVLKLLGGGMPDYCVNREVLGPT